MKTKEILTAQSARMFKMPANLGYLPDAIAKAQQRYSFVKLPLTVQELLPSDPNQGIMLGHGKFQQDSRVVVIESLKIFPLAVFAETRTSTDDADLFLEDLLAWATPTFGLVLEPLRAPVYFSRVEIELDASLGQQFSRFKPIASALNRMLETYGTQLPPCEVSSIWFGYDASKVPPLHGAASFRLDRKPNVPYDENRYFSEAPLKTDDHFALLEHTERVLMESR